MGTEDSEAISSKRRRVTKTVKTSTSQPQQNSSAVSLDETLDEFASGFTPYRMAATRGSRKLSRAKKSSTTTKKDETDTGKQNKSTSSVVSQEKGESSVSQPTETDPGENATVSCMVCSTLVPQAEYSQHRQACLKNKFQRKKDKPAKHPFIMCQVCQQDIGALDVDARTRHVNACIDNSVSSTSTADMELSTDVNNKEVCAVCHKKLGHLNILRRQQHVNRCMDKQEQKDRDRRDQEAALEEARNKVLDCPLCGKKLKTTNSRQSHMKKCAQTLSVPLPTLMERIRQQEEEHRVQLEAGIIPVDNARPRGRPRGRGRGASTSGTRNDTARGGTVNRLDEQTQLALALSTSLAEEQQRQRTSFGEFAAPLPQPSTSSSSTSDPPAADAFSILMSPKKVPEKKRKKKNRPQITPPLLLRTKEEMEQRMNAKVAELILPQEDDIIHSTPEIKSSSISRKYSRRKNGTAQPITLWRCGSHCEGTEKQDFYVPELQTYIEISTVVPGSKLKSVTSIPGRGLDDSLTAVSPKMADGNQTIVGNDTTLLASTQTAVLLAELAAEGGNMTLPMNTTLNTTKLGLNKSVKISDSSSPETSSSCLSFRICGGDETLLGSQLGNVPLADASGFIVQKQQEPDHSPTTCDQSLLHDLGAMVENQLASDLDIEVRGQKSLPAHKFMLAARCQNMYKEVCDSRTLCLSEYSEDAVKAMLTYIYTTCGTELKTRTLVECRALGQRFQLPEFYFACERASSKATSKAEEPDLPSSLDQTLHELLRQTWGSDSEEDSDAEEDGEDMGMEAEQREDAEIEELYEFMASQKRPQPAEEEEEEENEDGDGEENNHALNSTHISEQAIYALLNEDSDSPSNEDLVEANYKSADEPCSMDVESEEKECIDDHESGGLKMYNDPALSNVKNTVDENRTSMRDGTSMKDEASRKNGTSRKEGTFFNSQDKISRGFPGRSGAETGAAKSESIKSDDNNISAPTHDVDGNALGGTPEPIDCDEDDDGWEITLDDDAIMAASAESDTECSQKEVAEKESLVSSPLLSAKLTGKVGMSQISYAQDTSASKDSLGNSDSKIDKNKHTKCDQGIVATQVQSKLMDCSKLENNQGNTTHKKSSKAKTVSSVHMESNDNTPAPSKKESQLAPVIDNTPDNGSTSSRNATPDLFVCSPTDTSLRSQTSISADDDSMCSPIEDTPFVKRTNPSQVVKSGNSKEVGDVEEPTAAMSNPRRCFSAKLFDSEDSESDGEISLLDENNSTACSVDSDDDKESGSVGASRNVEGDREAPLRTESVLETPESQTMGELLLEVTSSPSDQELSHAAVNCEPNPNTTPDSPVFASQRPSTSANACKNLSKTFSDEEENQIGSKSEVISKPKKSRKRKISGDVISNVTTLKERSSTSSPQEKRNRIHSKQSDINTPTKCDVQPTSAESPVFSGKHQSGKQVESERDSSGPEEIDLTDDVDDVSDATAQKTEPQTNAISNGRKHGTLNKDHRSDEKNSDQEERELENDDSIVVSDGDNEEGLDENGEYQSSSNENKSRSASPIQNSPQYTQCDQIYEVVDMDEQSSGKQDQEVVDEDAAIEDDAAGGGDVWDGFEDDGGFGDDFSMPCSPPEPEEPEEHLPVTPYKSFPVSPTEDTASPNEDFWKAYDKSPVARKTYQPSEENMSSPLRKTARNSQHSESGNSTSSEIVNKKKISKSATIRSNVICDDSPGQKGAVIHSPAIKRLKEGNLNMTFDPPTDMETDCSMLCDDSFLFSAENEPTMDDDKRDKEELKATRPKPTRPAKQWVPPSPFTPMKPYSSMDTPALKRECQSFGLRAQPKKRMVKVLEACYKETHMLETDSEFEHSMMAPPVPEPTVPSSQGSPAKSPVATKPPPAKRRGRPPKEKPKPKATTSKKATTVLVETDSDASSEDEGSDSPSLCPEESMLAGELDEELPLTQCSPQKGRPKLTPEQRLQEKRNKILDYLTNTKHIREQILLYQPLEFDDFQEELKLNGINVGAGVIMDLLDEFNVLFSMRKRSQKKAEKKAARRKKKSPQKRSPKKTTPKKKPGRINSVSSSQSSR